MRPRRVSPRTEEASLDLMRRGWEFHGRRDPADLGEGQVTAFLNASALRGAVAASTQNQALSALPFPNCDVFGRGRPWLDKLVRAKRPARLPVAFPREEVRTNRIDVRRSEGRRRRYHSKTASLRDRRPAAAQAVRR